MKKKYKRALIIIAIMFLFTLGISTGYGFWKSIKEGASIDKSTTLNCFKVYYSNNSDRISLSNIKPMLNEDGKETTPYTITITNICEEEKEIQMRFNILNDNTIDLTSLSLLVSGNLESDVVSYNNLRNAKATNEQIKISKSLGVIKIKARETIRTNIKLWFDEKKINTLDSNALFSAQFEIVDTKLSVKPNFAETILLNNEVIDGSTLNYAELGVNPGLYKTVINDIDYYFFRGASTNNYVIFAEKTWRIVGINSDQSVKLVLNDSAGRSQYSSYRNAIDYTGLKYVYNNNLVDNQINKFLLQWYKTNIIDNGYDKYIEEKDFCNDTSNTIENYHRYFQAYSRLVTNKTPSIICNQTSEDFGGTINQKIGLLTADEVAMAGGLDGINNTSYYLYQPYDYFTSTPAEYYGYNAYVFFVNGAGNLMRTTVTDNMNIRPVININSSQTANGLGTIDNPYTIENS